MRTDKATTLHVNHDIENVLDLVGKRVEITIKAIVTNISVDNNLVEIKHPFKDDHAVISEGQTTELVIMEYEAKVDKILTEWPDLCPHECNDEMKAKCTGVDEQGRCKLLL